MRQFNAEVKRRDRIALFAAAGVSVALVLVYVAATHPPSLLGDQAEYHQQGVLFSEGKPWWSLRPYGEPHASAWKAPLYTLWVGGIYTVAGTSPTAVFGMQALLAGLTVIFTWVLARRLFGDRVALISAWVVALFPLVWEWFGLLYTEALAIPLTLAILIAFVDRMPSRNRAISVGALLGVAILLRPTSFFLFAGVAATWVVACGWKRGAGYSAITALVAVLVVVPWTVRNYVVLDGFIPVSVQDAASYGTFNDESANDPVFPYSWRPVTDESTELLSGERLTEPELRSELSDIGTEYIKEHPSSVAEAFFWNGLSRYWDVRRPARAIDEVDFEGRSAVVTGIGLAAYYALLPLAIVGLIRYWSNRRLVIPLCVMALAASLVFTVASGTRYRAPLEPLIAVLAVAGVVSLRGPARDVQP